MTHRVVNFYHSVVFAYVPVFEIYTQGLCQIPVSISCIYQLHLRQQRRNGLYMNIYIITYGDMYFFNLAGRAVILDGECLLCFHLECVVWVCVLDGSVDSLKQML